MNREYHLASKELVKHFGPCDRSKFIDRFGKKVCVILVPFDSLESWAQKKGEDFLFENDIWSREIIECNISVESFELSEAKERGLFNWIIDVLGLSTEKNVAAVIGSICKNEGITPIQLFNKL